VKTMQYPPTLCALALSLSILCSPPATIEFISLTQVGHVDTA
jgi:hypothetical protein